MLALATSANADQTARIKLDGIEICPPKDYILRSNFQSFPKKHFDQGYDDVLLSVPSADINPEHEAGVILYIANRSAISGFSQAQTELIALSQKDLSRFRPIEGSSFFSVHRKPQFSFVGYDVVRWMPSGKEQWATRGAKVENHENIHHWVVASNCRLPSMGPLGCQVQRVYGELSYKFEHWGDPANIESAVGKLEIEMDAWLNACNQET